MKRKHAVLDVLTAAVIVYSSFASAPRVYAETKYDTALAHVKEAGYDAENVHSALHGKDLADILKAAASWDDKLSEKIGKIDEEKEVTRKDLAEILYDCAGSPDTQAESGYTDVKTNDMKAAAYLKEKGAMTGLTKTLFNPDGMATKLNAVYAVDTLFHEHETSSGSSGWGPAGVRYPSEVTATGAPKTANDITAEEFLAAATKVVKGAVGCNYGDSHGFPPCSDGYSSCDRLIARTLWELGFTDQTAGGWYMARGLGEDPYLRSHGWIRSTDMNDIQAGSIFDIDGHTFIVVSYDPNTGTGMKYDHGSTDKIHLGGAMPFTTRGADPYGGGRHFLGVWNLPSMYQPKTEAKAEESAEKTADATVETTAETAADTTADADAGDASANTGQAPAEGTETVSVSLGE